MEIENDCERGQRDQGERGDQQGLHRPRVTRHVESVPKAEQRQQQEQPERRLFDVQPLDQVRDRDPEDEGHCELPGSLPSACERTRQPDEREPESECRDPRGPENARRKHAANELVTVRELGRERRGDADHPDRGSRPAERHLAAKASELHDTRVAPVSAGRRAQR